MSEYHMLSPWWARALVGGVMGAVCGLACAGLYLKGVPAAPWDKTLAAGLLVGAAVGAVGWVFNRRL